MWPLTYGDFSWAEVVNSWWTKRQWSGMREMYSRCILSRTTQLADMESFQHWSVWGGGKGHGWQKCQVLHVSLHTNTYMYMSALTHTHTRAHTHAHMQTYTHTRTHTQTHTQTCTHMHTHTQTHMHTHTHAHAMLHNSQDYPLNATSHNVY